MAVRLSGHNTGLEQCRKAVKITIDKSVNKFVKQQVNEYISKYVNKYVREATRKIAETQLPR